jgi:transcriptional antiterminator RfaH
MRETPLPSFRAGHPSMKSDSAIKDRNWFAVYTVPQHEKSVIKRLEIRQVESFLPTYETTHLWKNQQRVKVTLPLFPTYLFVRIHSTQRTAVLGTPGVITIVGNGRGPIPISDSDIGFLRAEFCRQRVEPYRDLVVGRQVRIKSGPMQGVRGVLVRKKNSLRFVLSLELINQHAAVEVSAQELEPVPNQ